MTFQYPVVGFRILFDVSPIDTLLPTIEAAIIGPSIAGLIKGGVISLGLLEYSSCDSWPFVTVVGFQ